MFRIGRAPSVLNIFSPDEILLSQPLEQRIPHGHRSKFRGMVCEFDLDSENTSYLVQTGCVRNTKIKCAALFHHPHEFRRNRFGGIPQDHRLCPAFPEGIVRRVHPESIAETVPVLTIRGNRSPSRRHQRSREILQEIPEKEPRCRIKRK